MALYEAVFAMMESLVPRNSTSSASKETHRQHHARHHALQHPHDADGKHVTIGANGDAIFRHWPRPWAPDLADDPALADNAGRDAPPRRALRHHRRLVRRPGRGGAPRSGWKAEVPASRVYSGGRHVCRSAVPRPVDDRIGALPDGRELKMPGSCLLSGPPRPATQWGTGTGRHTDAVLAELGYGPERIAALRAAGAVWDQT